MSIDKPKLAPKVEQYDTHEHSRTRLLCELIQLNERMTRLAPTIDGVPLRSPMPQHRMLGALSVEVGALIADPTRARRVEDQLRSDLAIQVASHEAQLSECRAQFASCQADLARSQAENVALRRENADINDELRQAQQQHGEDEYEIAMLRHRLELPQRPSPLDVN